MAGHGHRNIPLLLPLLFLAALPSSVAQNGGDRNDGPTPAFGFSNSTTILIAILGSSFVVFSIFSFYLRHYAGGTAGVGQHSVWLQPEQVGLSSDVLATFPTVVYAAVKGLRIGRKQELECAVCLSEFDDADTLRLLPACSHAFHVDCVDPWLASHTTCPVCRTDLAAAANGGDPPGPSGEVDEDAANGPEQSNFQVAIEMESEEAEQRRRNVAEPIRYSVDDPHKLRLPEEVLREIFARRNLSRSASFHVDTREQSRRQGGDSDRWSGILTRTLSSSFVLLEMEKREEGESSMER